MNPLGSLHSLGASRRGYIDWLRGISVLIMIEAHTLDAWTRRLVLPETHATA